MNPMAHRAGVRRRRQWLACRIVALLTLLVALSPLTMPAGISNPRILGTPYTLWVSLALTVLLLLLTWLGSQLQTREEE